MATQRATPEGTTSVHEPGQEENAAGAPEAMQEPQAALSMGGGHAALISAAQVDIAGEPRR